MASTPLHESEMKVPSFEFRVECIVLPAADVLARVTWWA
jgi:hypothetical protein